MEYHFKSIEDVVINGRKVILRVDFNVPLDAKKKVLNDYRIQQSLPTIKFLLKHNAKIILLSHWGRVTKKEDLLSHSLLPVYEYFITLFPQTKIKFTKDIEGGQLEKNIRELQPGQILFIENTRFADITDMSGEINNKAMRESENSEQLARYWASLADVFVNDAFSTVHRKHASNFGIANFIKESCIGFLIQKELSHLQKLLQPQKPYIVFVGGAKVSDKIALLDKVLPLADYVVIGGAMAFTFLKAQDVNIGKSLLETVQINVVKNYLSCYAQKIILPQDFIVNVDLNTTTPGKLTSDTNIPADFAGYDVGKKSLATYQSLVKQAQTIFWNGPFGVYENPLYAAGTLKLCEILGAQNNAFRVVGGGDLVSAVFHLKMATKFNFISTGGGATLALISGATLPGLEKIKRK